MPYVTAFTQCRLNGGSPRGPPFVSEMRSRMPKLVPQYHHPWDALVGATRFEAMIYGANATPNLIVNTSSSAHYPLFCCCCCCVEPHLHHFIQVIPVRGCTAGNFPSVKGLAAHWRRNLAIDALRSQKWRWMRLARPISSYSNSLFNLTPLVNLVMNLPAIEYHTW
jgi:hypothetical protein